MNRKNEVTVKGRNVNQTIEKAAKALGIDTDEVGYRVIAEKKSGLMYLFGRGIELVAWKREPRHGASSRSPHRRVKDAGKREKSLVEFTEDEIETLVEDLRSFCEELCSHLAGTDVKVDAVIENDKLMLDIDSADLAEMMVKNSKLAESLEHLLRKKPRHLKRELPFKIFVDVKSVRKDREEELTLLAKDLSNKVSKSNRPIVLNYRSAYDRKMIHMALEKDDRVHTKSIGHGPGRKLMILPSKDGQRSEREELD